MTRTGGSYLAPECPSLVGVSKIKGGLWKAHENSTSEPPQASVWLLEHESAPDAWRPKGPKSSEWSRQRKATSELFSCQSIGIKTSKAQRVAVKRFGVMTETLTD